MRGVERQSLLKRALIGTLIAFAFGLAFSLLIEVGIPLKLQASGAKKCRCAAASRASPVSAVSTG